MNDSLIKIELFGILRKNFGKEHLRIVSSTSEAIRALCHTLKGFEQFLNTSKARGLTFAIYKGAKNIGLDDLGFPITETVIRIVPVIIGSKKAGLLQTILGAVLVAVSIWMPGLSIAASNIMFAAGASMTLGGIVQMLSPQPGGLASKQDADNQASYAFGGVTNTAAQGNPVPLGYGRRRIGGAIVSAGIYVEDKQ
ncbi:tail assembly protein [Kluyvera cryocrescens]|uniref:tail assembly protein n=1 Tax=Kluyvera TaxID=579 RepID=UPI0006A9FBFD|nr:tail assembly protein [Kluyvera cryocrescens]